MSAPSTTDGVAHPDEGAALRDTFRYLSVLHGSIRGPLAAIVVLGAIAGLLEAAALIAFVRAAIDITVGDTPDPTVAGITLSMSPGTLLIVAAVLAVITAGLHVLLARRSVALGEQIAVNSRTRLISSFLEAQWSYVAKYQSGRLQEAVSSLANTASTAATNFAFGLSSAVIIAALAVAAIIVSPLVSALLLTVPTVAFMATRSTIRRLRQSADVNVVASMGLSEATANTANLALEYRTTGTQQVQARRLAELARSHSMAVAAVRRKLFTVAFLFKDSALLALIAVVGVLYLTTDLRTSSVTAAVLLLIRLLGYLQQAFRLVQEGVEQLAVVEELRNSIEELEDHRELDGDVAVDHLGPIEFQSVSFSYEPNRPALHDVSFTIQPCTTIGIVGPSGAGKSTITELLLGLRVPTDGQITVGGIPIESLRRADWTRLTGLVPQQQQLAELPVRENIRFLRDRITDSDVESAARRAHVHDEISALPDGYDHVIGRQSRGLSGGQRQRIAIARALAGSPQLLVLDEPTSALDATTEQLMRQTLLELHGRITIVVIAHRPTTLETCDVIIRLGGGRLETIEPGPLSLGAGTAPALD